MLFHNIQALPWFLEVTHAIIKFRPLMRTGDQSGTSIHSRLPLLVEWGGKEKKKRGEERKEKIGKYWNMFVLQWQQRAKELWERIGKEGVPKSPFRGRSRDLVFHVREEKKEGKGKGKGGGEGERKVLPTHFNPPERA